jgi:hypothetical protein
MTSRRIANSDHMHFVTDGNSSRACRWAIPTAIRPHIEAKEATQKPIIAYWVEGCIAATQMAVDFRLAPDS